MNITLERNRGADRLNIPYIAAVDMMSNATNHQLQIPIDVSYIGMKKTFGVNLCGFQMQTAEFSELSEMIERLLRALTNAKRLPTYVFIARNAQTIYPIYTVEDDVFVVTPREGPVLRHIELAKVREYITDYLHDTRQLGSDGQRDKLHIRGVHASTLRLRRPIFYLKKRLVGETEFWAPVFIGGDEAHIYTYAVSQRRNMALAAGLEVLQLRDKVATLLQQDKRLKNHHDLRPDRLFPDRLALLTEHLTEQADSFHFEGRSFPVFIDGEGRWIASEKRVDENRYNLYLGDSRDALFDQINRNLARRKMQDASK